MAGKINAKDVKTLTAAVSQRLKQLDIIAHQGMKMQEKMTAEADLLLRSDAVKNDIARVLSGGCDPRRRAGGKHVPVVFRESGEAEEGGAGVRLS